MKLSTREKFCLTYEVPSTGMALYHYMQPLDTLPDPKGPLSYSVTAIKEANKAVHAVERKMHPKQRGLYVKIPLEQQAKIAEYASLHGKQAAVCSFSKEMALDVKESSMRTWRSTSPKLVTSDELGKRI